MIWLSLLGALLAGIYGILHDQITYSISEEYFTKLKFQQFSYADFGLPDRVFVAEIGFLATWWVGLISAWLLSRVALPAWPLQQAYQKCFVCFGIIFVAAVIGGFVGYIFGITHNNDYVTWQNTCTSLGINHKRDFITVAMMHYAGYAGGIVGLIFSLLYMRMKKRYKQR